ncbi:Hypothetical protein DHA2_14677 [Giardia duodenalis]|uniref:Uncharacterized protein n=1 Tax=Giardia intestinalis TaxID=5741 RepID=V6TRY7_GIAIN|nr:Hypothetical protein DHA2_14677 [Giardia intestinalis]
MGKDPLFIVTRLNNAQLLVEQGTLNVGPDFSVESNWHSIDWFKTQSERLLEVIPLNKKNLICCILSTQITCIDITTSGRPCSLSLQSPISHYCYYEYLPMCLFLAIQTSDTLRVYKLVYEGQQPYFQTIYEFPSDLLLGLGKIMTMSMCPDFLAICTCVYPHGKRSALTTINVFHILDDRWSSNAEDSRETKDDGESNPGPGSVSTTAFQLLGRPKTIQFDKASQLIIVLKRSETYYFFRYKFFSELTSEGAPVVRGELLSEPATGMQYQFRSCISKHSILYAGRYPNYVCIECRRNPRSFTFAAHCEFSSEREVVGVSNTPNGSFVAAVDPNRTHIDLYYNFCFCASIQLVGKGGPIQKGSKLLGCCILPESYYLLAYTSTGLMALYCIQNCSYGLFQVNRTYTLPLASYAIERTRRSLLVLYDTHYLYLYIKPTDDMDSLTSATAWCPNPAHVAAYQKIFTDERGAMEIAGFTTGVAGDKSIINITLKFKTDESFVVTLDLEDGDFVPDSLTAAIASTTARIESTGAQTAVHNLSPQSPDTTAAPTSTSIPAPDSRICNTTNPNTYLEDEREQVQSVLSSIPTSEQPSADNTDTQVA